MRRRKTSSENFPRNSDQSSESAKQLARVVRLAGLSRSSIAVATGQGRRPDEKEWALRKIAVRFSHCVTRVWGCRSEAHDNTHPPNFLRVMQTLRSRDNH
jgi:hypothetical protein